MVFATVNPKIEPVSRSVITTRLVLIVEYDGARYHGSQLQSDLPTIQSELEKAVQKLTGEKIRLLAASRTDAGVHARGQVISFYTSSYLPVEKFISGLNYYLPDDIAIKAAHRTDDAFNVRHGATSREYSYYILNSSNRSPLWEGRAHHVPGHLDTGAMNQACQVLIGTHDFASFATSTEGNTKSTIRRVHHAGVEKDGEMVIFSIIANAFLPHQVRNTIGALIRVGRGKVSRDEFYSIMESRRPGLAWPTAPACGLYLVRVNYPQPFEGIS